MENEYLPPQCERSAMAGAIPKGRSDEKKFGI
jgi:hypothetical protein